MKRDMELVRKLLFLAEEDGKDDKLCEEYGQDVVAGHVAILLDAKLIEGKSLVIKWANRLLRSSFA